MDDTSNHPSWQLKNVIIGFATYVTPMLHHVKPYNSHSCEPGSSSPGSPSLAARSWEWGHGYFTNNGGLWRCSLNKISFLEMNIGELARTAWGCYEKNSACFDTHHRWVCPKGFSDVFPQDWNQGPKSQVAPGTVPKFIRHRMGLSFKLPRWPGVSFWLLRLRAVGPDMDRMDMASLVAVRFT